MRIAIIQSGKDILLFLSLFVLLNSCKKSFIQVPDQPDGTPAITEVGEPVGDPITKTIGINGGEIVSADGRLQLSIPAEALLGDMEISVQPIMNEAPGGTGLAYQLLPEGTRFDKPVTITYHYSDEDVNGSHPYFLYIAFQDSTGLWRADLKNRDLDTLAKTISIASTHFSSWSLIQKVKLYAPQTKFTQNQTGIIEVQIAQTVEDDDLPPLPKLVPAKNVGKWSLTWFGRPTTEHGRLTGSGSKVTYVSPALIETQDLVHVSVEVTEKETIYNRGKEVTKLEKFTLGLDLDLLTNNHKYTLTMEIEDDLVNNTAYGWSYTYFDHASMDIEIVGDKSTISNIRNFHPQFYLKALDDFEAVSLEDSASVGELNITKVECFVDANTKHVFNLKIHSEQGKSLAYKIRNIKMRPPGDWEIFNGDPVNLVYSTKDFALENKGRTIYEGSGIHYFTKYILKTKN
ncbi:hypothetical protein [Flavihumibacter profundi]|uniref:hypothetical protein n=1 Tax=Flavihumibacter profundi TaxID=2716883 RepID=UPI001CC80C36|nr:hypothetical protein [Flavihumibacter profundi]MBZ5857703.1 hypothetical protein [Flavihumibacter profundi]